MLEQLSYEERLRELVFSTGTAAQRAVGTPSLEMLKVRLDGLWAA